MALISGTVRPFIHGPSRFVASPVRPRTASHLALPTRTRQPIHLSLPLPAARGAGGTCHSRRPAPAPAALSTQIVPHDPLPCTPAFFLCNPASNLMHPTHLSPVFGSPADRLGRPLPHWHFVCGSISLPTLHPMCLHVRFPACVTCHSLAWSHQRPDVLGGVMHSKACKRVNQTQA